MAAPIAAMFSLSAHAQSPIGVCQALATSGLVDKDDLIYSESVAFSEFREVCSNRERREQNFKSSSSGFQARFKVYALGNSGANASGMSKEEIDQACDRGEKAYSRHIGLEHKQNRGGFLAQQVNECVRTAVGKHEFLAGTVEPVADSDDRFVADFSFTPGPRDGKYTLASIEGSADVKCFIGADLTQTAIGASLTSSLSITCNRPAGRPSTGRFLFRSTVDGNTLRVPFAVPSKSVQEKAFELLKSEFRGELDQRVVRAVEPLQRRSDDLYRRVNSALKRCKVQLEATYTTDCAPGQLNSYQMPVVETSLTPVNGGFSSWSAWQIANPWNGGTQNCIRARLYCE